MRISFLAILISLFVIGCIPVTEEAITEVTQDVNDGMFRQIYDYQDKQDLDSLLEFSNHFDPSYRFIVANGLASIQSEDGLDSLYSLLYDPVMKVRTAAAYAIGQVGSQSSVTELLKAFKTKDTLDVDNIYNSTILESIGKVGKANLLPSLATVSTYRTTDTLLLVGQARAIYNYALRGITSPEGTDKLVQYLTEEGYPYKVQLIAANYLARAKDLDLESYKFRLAEEFVGHENPNIRMALAIALGKSKDNEVFSILKEQFDIEEDYRVKTNILRSLSNFSYIRVIEPIVNLLGEDNLNISNTAADFLIHNGIKNDAVIYKNYLNDSLHYTVQAKIYSAVLKHMPVYYTNTKNGIKKEIQDKIEASKDPYEIASYLTALGYDPFNYQAILDLSSDSEHAVVRSTGASAVTNILTSPSFIQAYRGGQLRKKREIVELIKAEIVKGDEGVLAIYGELLADESLDMKAIVDDPSFLKNAMSNLKLPKEIETYNSLNKAYSYLSGGKYVAKTPEWNHPVNWSVFSTYGDSVQVAIKTQKGVIRIQMYTKEAPGSVANFLTLAKDDYYDGKNIHRVVPNFVIQGGCPRGDGYGAQNYSIRSELPQLYYEEEGLLGMASAGLHTEGTQWFITHSPALHLSGKYTIFGKVIDGMDVVHNLSVGDLIEDVIITKG